MPNRDDVYDDLIDTLASHGIMWAVEGVMDSLDGNVEWDDDEDEER